MSKRAYLLGTAAAMAGIAFAPETGSGSGGPDFEAAERSAKILVALGKLDPTEDSHWTEGGLPAMEHMKAATAIEDLKRDEVAKAAPGLHRANINAAPSDLGNVGGGGDTGPTTEAEIEAVKAEGKLAIAPMWEEKCMPLDVAKVFPDPIFLIEAAVAAMNADVRYSKNGALFTFMRHYLVDQPAIKEHQKRLDLRYAEKKAAG